MKRCRIMLRRYKSEGWVAIVTHNGPDDCGPFHAWYTPGRPSLRQARRAGRDLARLRMRLPEHLRGQAGDAPWTCARCDKPIHAEPHTDSDGADVHPDCCEACHPERGA